MSTATPERVVPGAPLRQDDAARPDGSARPRSVATRRLAAGLIDALLLVGGIVLVLATGLAIGTEEEVSWALLAWTLLFAPLYFGLYHAFDNGATPGGLELRLGLREERSQSLAGPARAIARAYLGLVFVLLVLPAVADMVELLRSGRSLRDRLTGTALVRIPLAGPEPELREETAAHLRAIFEPPAGTRAYLRRGWALLRARPRLLVGTVAVVYGFLVALTVLLAVLFVADTPGDLESATVWLLIAMALLGSGVYWTQAAVALAVEEVRAGLRAPVLGTVVRSTRRANALSAALVLLLGFAYLAFVVFPLLLLAGRLTLVAPALVLEDRRVLGSFRRSWQLTSGQAFRTLGLLVLGGALLVAAPWAGVLAAYPLTLLGGPEVLAWVAFAVSVGVAIAAVVAVLAWLGAAWSLLYEDARRRRPPEETR